MQTGIAPAPMVPTAPVVNPPEMKPPVDLAPETVVPAPMASILSASPMMPASPMTPMTDPAPSMSSAPIMNAPMSASADPMSNPFAAPAAPVAPVAQPAEQATMGPKLPEPSTAAATAKPSSMKKILPILILLVIVAGIAVAAIIMLSNRNATPKQIIESPTAPATESMQQDQALEMPTTPEQTESAIMEQENIAAQPAEAAAPVPQQVPSFPKGSVKGITSPPSAEQLWGNYNKTQPSVQQQ